MGLCLALAGACGLWVPVALAQDKGIETISRSSQWLVNFDDNSCDLAAEFGPPEDRMVMRLTRYSMGSGTDVSVLGKRLETKQAWLDVNLDFGLGGGQPRPQQAAGVTQAKLPGFILAGIRFDRWQGTGEAPDITPAQEASVTGVTVKAAGKKPFRLQFGSLDKPMQVMRKCLTDLIQSWGYDPATIAALSRPVKPAGNPATWFSDDDYPVGAMEKGHNGMLRFRLDIDTEGAVAGCHILDRTDPDDFAKVTCSTLSKHARFKPALDAGGKPVRAFYLGTMNWKAS